VGVPCVSLLFDMGKRRSRVLDRAVRRDETARAVVALRPERRRTDVELARLFHDLNSHLHYVYRSCANIGEYGEKHGYSAREARTLAAAGEALELNPEIEERLLDGRISLDAAAALGKIYEDPSLIKDGEDWLQKAEVLAASQLHREIKRRLLEAEEGEPTTHMDVLMTSKDREAFERARQVVCQKVNSVLDEGRTIGWLSNYFLDREDPDRVEEGTRRVGETAHTDSRYIPASVRRKVRKRAGGMCQHPGCCNRILMYFPVCNPPLLTEGPGAQ